VKLSRVQFAAKCGVSKMAISYAVRAGKVIEDDKGKVDTASPLNRAFLQADHTAMKRAKAKGRAEGRGSVSKKRADLWERNIRAQIAEREARTAKLDVERAKLLGMLVERRMMLASFAAFGAEWKPQLLDMPKRLIPRIYDMFRAGKSEQEAVQYAEKEVFGATQALKNKGREVELGDLT
jgi:hypothetical protein